ncbi:MAG: dihydroneopterin aldolase [Acidimicrobiales bacterium]
MRDIAGHSRGGHGYEPRRRSGDDDVGAYELCQRDSIEVRGLRFMGTHGALEEEAVRPQPFEVDLSIFADLGLACQSDDLADTIDYSELCEAVRSVVEGPHVRLLERLAQKVADGVLAVAGDRASRVMVTVRKLRAPLAVQLASVAVRIERP